MTKALTARYWISHWLESVDELQKSQCIAAVDALFHRSCCTIYQGAIARLTSMPDGVHQYWETLLQPDCHQHGIDQTCWANDIYTILQYCFQAKIGLMQRASFALIRETIQPCPCAMRLSPQPHSCFQTPATNYTFCVSNIPNCYRVKSRLF